MPLKDSAIIEALWVKRAHRGVLDAHTAVDLVEGAGVAESADRGGKRQVTVLSAEAWEAACREIGRELDPVLRRANVLVRGMDFEATRGQVLQLGTARLE
ncbi:MAG: sulfurase, partial [Acidobacteriota bacterium]